MAVGFVLIGFLAACTPESVNLNKEAMPSSSPIPSISPSQLTSPTPSAPASPLETSVVPTATSTPSPSATSLAPERCTLDGELTYEHIVPREIVKTNPEFNFKEIQASRFMCHNSIDDTLIITNQKEVLAFDPKTLKVKIIIGENLTGFNSDQDRNLQFKRLEECIVDKTGAIYLADRLTQEVYLVDVKAKKITTLQHTPYKAFSAAPLTTKFEGSVRFALTPQKQVLLSNTEHLYAVNGSKLDLLFRADPFNSTAYTGFHKIMFPQRLNESFAIEEMESISGIAVDNKNNIYMTNSNQRAFFKLTPDKLVYLVNPVASNLLYSKGTTPLDVGIVNTLEYAPKYNVFFGRPSLGGSPVVITRDGCLHELNAPSSSPDNVSKSIITDIASTNDGSVYIFDSEKMRISRLEIPPDLPEKAQWEPPQAWKNATGIE